MAAPRNDWRPSASWGVLKKRAELLGQIRAFFAARGVIEVDPPLLGEAGVTDLHIDCIEAFVGGQRHYLQSSPEYYMKRLLAAGAGPIYSLGKAFRDGERGRRHRPEFTLLEWYRPGWDEDRLMDEVKDLIQSVARGALTVSRQSYRDVFLDATGLDPHGAELSRLQSLASSLCGGDWHAEGRATLLDLLFSQVVEPRLDEGLVFIHHYPACQAALAARGKDAQGAAIARRFEVFFNRLELGNGYYELTDADEQRQRFAADIALRETQGRKAMETDVKLLAALEVGLPSCAGVAMGVDRLLMQLSACHDISEVMPFG